MPLFRGPNVSVPVDLLEVLVKHSGFNGRADYDNPSGELIDFIMAKAEAKRIVENDQPDISDASAK